MQSPGFCLPVSAAKIQAAVTSRRFSSTRHCGSRTYAKENRQCISTLAVFYGRGWIRTTEAESSRFTVCPHWPLGNTPIYSFDAVVDCLYILPLGGVFVNSFLRLFWCEMLKKGATLREDTKGGRDAASHRLRQSGSSLPAIGAARQETTLRSASFTLSVFRSGAPFWRGGCCAGW